MLAGVRSGGCRARSADRRLVALFVVLDNVPHPIRGAPPDPRSLPSGCAFWPRCTQKRRALLAADRLGSRRRARGSSHATSEGLKRLLSAPGLRKSLRRGGEELRALDGVSLDVEHGESLGIVGPPGSGKTTLARIFAGRLEPDAGELFIGHVSPSVPRKRRALRAGVQLVCRIRGTARTVVHRRRRRWASRSCSSPTTWRSCAR